MGTWNISRLGGQALGLLQGDSARGASASPGDPEAADGPQHLHELYAGAAWSGSLGCLVSADDAYGVALVGDVGALPGCEMPEERLRKIIQTMSEGATNHFPP